MALGVTYPATPPPRTRTHRRARGVLPTARWHHLLPVGQQRGPGHPASTRTPPWMQEQLWPGSREHTGHGEDGNGWLAGVSH